MIRIESLNQLHEIAQKEESLFLLIYKKGSEQSECAYRNFEASFHSEVKAKGYYVDTTLTRDVHTAYGITTAPTLLSFEKSALVSEIKGCHDVEFYRSIILQQSFTATGRSEEGKSMKNVVVYTTPTCSWCNTLKGWLRKNQISFREVNVASDSQAAETMVRKSGQQGVPQTEIDGRIVVGFDQTKLKNLLGINS